MRKAYFYPALVLCLAVIAALAFHLWFSRSTVIVLVRHAEKASEPRTDPPLTRAGQERAEDLARAVSNLGVEHILHSEYERTRATVAPAAEALGITPRVVKAGDYDEVVRSVKNEYKGSVILLAGHSNTVPEIIERLGVPDPPVLSEQDYDDLFLVRCYPFGRTAFMHLHYGRSAESVTAPAPESSRTSIPEGD